MTYYGAVGTPQRLASGRERSIKEAMKENDIRPQKIFERYLELAQADTKRFFSRSDRFVETPCPACGSDEARLAFEKDGFAYQVCGECQSLYNSPRPTPDMFGLYFQEAASVKFWSQEFYQATEANRRKMIYRPRAKMVAEMAVSYGQEKGEMVDLGSGYGTMLEEVAALNCFSRVRGVDCSPGLIEVCRSKGFEVIFKLVEELQPGDLRAGFATSFEVLEHLFDPLLFLQGVKNILEPEGVFLFTTLTCSGFDIRVLGRHSKSVSPPHHLNLLSIAGMEALLERAGFEILQLTTPGRLDVDIVRNALESNPGLELDPFLADLVQSPDEELRAEFQRFLAANRLSSHLQVAARPAGA